MGTLSKKKLALLGTVLLVIVSIVINAYFLRVVIAGDALWNDHEAYFFVRRINRGIQKKWIQVPLFVVLNRLGLIEPPADNSASLIVIHITPSGVERHELELDPTPGKNPSRYTPREGRIWANFWSIGGLSWWTGDHFEPATAEEKNRIGGIADLDNYPLENGWSKRMIGDQGFTEKFANGQRMTVFSGPEAMEIRMGRGPEAKTIFFLEAHAGLTSRSEYRRVFGKTH